MLPVVISEASSIIVEAAPALRAAAAKVVLPGVAAGAAVVRSSLVARLRAMYNVLPAAGRSIIAGTLVGLGVEGVTNEVQAFLHAEKDQTTFAMILINLAQQGLDPSFVAPPEYVAKLSSTDKAMFMNAKAAYASFVAGHPERTTGVASQGSALDATSVRIGVVENVRAVASIFGIRDVGGLLSFQNAMKQFMATSPADIAVAGATISASGGRL